MKHTACALCLILLAFAGCEQEPPPPPPPEAPPPPTAQQLYTEIKTALQVVYAAEGRGVGLDDTAARQAIATFPALVQKCRVPENKANGDEALSKVRTDFERMLRESPEYNKWRLVRCVLDLYKVIEPNLQKYEALDRKTDHMLNRPWVRSTGFGSLDGELVAFVRVTPMETGQPMHDKVETYRVREGEQFHPDEHGTFILRLVRVIGNKEKLEIEYIPIADTWEVMGAGNRL